MWSRERISQDDDDATILEKVERRFGKTFPLDHLNLFFCIALEDEEAHKEDKKVEEKKPEPAAAAIAIAADNAGAKK